MPLKVKAIVNAIKGTPLCFGSLYDRNKGMHCVMGALLQKVGMSNEMLERMDDDGLGHYWHRMGPEYRRKLKERFGIASAKDVGELVDLNDALYSGYSSRTSGLKRSCHIMTMLLKKGE